MLAVVHLRHDLLALFSQFCQLFVGNGLHKFKCASFHRNHLHDVGDKAAHGFYGLHHLRHMAVIDSFDRHNIYLHKNTAGNQETDSGKLVCHHNGACRISPVLIPHKPDILVHLTADMRVHRI